MKSSNARLDVETLEVICEECDRPISNITDTMKRVLKSHGQIIRTTSRQAFMMACKHCNANRQVVLDDKDQTICGICQNPINVHPAMKQAILQAGVKLSAQAKKNSEKK